MAEFDLLSLGDASLDVFITPSESETFCKIDTHKSLLCFTYGDKIPIKDFSTSIGGNAANNAVGTSRLGIKSVAVLTLGDDEAGSNIVDALKKDGVNTKYITRQEKTSSNYSTIINVSGERTIFTFKTPRSYAFPANLPKVPWVYLTSLGDEFRPFYKKLVIWSSENPNVKIAFNPGSRQLRVGTEAIKEVLRASFVIYVNRKEAEGLTGLAHTHGKEKDLLLALCKLGPKVPIVTDGSSGSFAYDGKSYFKAGILPIDSYERTGAGDAFGSGCLAALIKGKDLREALVWGAVNSSSVIGYTGAQKGLLKEQNLPSWIEKAESSGLKVEEF